MQVNGKELLPCGRTAVMGILNVTPDSFSDGGKYVSPDAAREQAGRLVAAGADILDIGGQSTRPGYTPISAKEEWARLDPVLSDICQTVGVPVSVDTFYPEVAEWALRAGAQIINDVSGAINPEMAAVVCNFGAAWILMHNGPLGPEDPVGQVHTALASMAAAAEGLGVPKASICLDPGIGFGKTLEQNYLLIQQTAKVKVEGYAYLLGASRKRCIGAPAGDPPFEARDPGTVAAHTIGILGGADIIRVHDVAGAVQAARVADAIKGVHAPC